MEERKHIDRLYQEKFKDFEATPREAVWNNISSRLQKKERKRRILPIWYRIAGVAAVLALFFNFASDFLKNTLSLNNTIVTSEPNNFGEFDLSSPDFNQNMFRSSLVLQALRLDTENEILRNHLKSTTPIPIQAERVFAGTLTAPVILNLEDNQISSATLSGQVAAISLTSKEEPALLTNNLIPVPEKEENPLAEESTENKIMGKRFTVTTNASPVYFDNFGKGNAIDPRFAKNNSDGEVSMSYGINIAYQITEKIKVRSGISKVDLSHNTKNISFTAAVNPSVLSGIDYKGNIPNYRIENSPTRPFSNINASSEFSRASLAAPTTGYLNQSLGFIEVPMEIEYNLIDKKIGLNLIGGGSTLFLNENMVSLNSADFSTNIGEANNLNSVSFSTNIGVGIDYNISSQFQLNVEPILKYQIHTFSGDNANLAPYYFGIYSGFSFKF